LSISSVRNDYKMKRPGKPGAAVAFALAGKW
jgi:hypothetical protein